MLTVIIGWIYFGRVWFVLKDVKDKIMLSSFILFLIVGGITFNFYNSLSTMLKKICLISTTILLVIVIAFMISKKNKDFFK